MRAHERQGYVDDELTGAMVIASLFISVGFLAMGGVFLWIILGAKW